MSVGIFTSEGYVPLGELNTGSNEHVAAYSDYMSFATWWSVYTMEYPMSSSSWIWFNLWWSKEDLLNFDRFPQDFSNSVLLADIDCVKTEDGTTLVPGEDYKVIKAAILGDEANEEQYWKATWYFMPKSSRAEGQYIRIYRSSLLAYRRSDSDSSAASLSSAAPLALMTRLSSPIGTVKGHEESGILEGEIDEGEMT